MMRKKLPWFGCKEKKVGYALTQALTQGNDNSYKAQMSTLKAAFAFKELADKSLTNSIQMFFPIIILDGALFECFLDSKGKMELKEKNHIFLQNLYFQDNNELVHIQIVKKEYLNDFILEANAMYTELTKIFSHEIKDLLNQ